MQEKNTNERAIVRIRIPTRKVTTLDELLDEHGQVHRVPNHQVIEVEMDDKAFLVPARVEALPFSVYVLNQAVSRAHRHEIFAFVRKTFPEYFDGRDGQKDVDDLCNIADAFHDKIENYFLQKYSEPDACPQFDFEINVNE